MAYIAHNIGYFCTFAPKKLHNNGKKTPQAATISP